MGENDSIFKNYGFKIFILINNTNLLKKKDALFVIDNLQLVNQPTYLSILHFHITARNQ